jgi:purine nucleosidase
MQSVSNNAPFYLDCDTGIDDSLALSYLLSCNHIDLLGVGTVSGNVSAQRAAQNTLDLLSLAGREHIPVAVGSHDPLCGCFNGGVPHIHGVNGVGNVQLPSSTRQPMNQPAADLLVCLARQHPGRLNILAIGPLTNIAQALALEPTLPDLVNSITIMGGAALVPGNLSPVAEANIGNDPEAAAKVFAASWDITLVPLDVTLNSTLEEVDRETLLASSRPLANALGRMLDLYFDFYVDTYGRRCCALHDPMAAAIAVNAISLRNAPIVTTVIDATHGPGRGQTICDLRGRRGGYSAQSGAHCRVVLELESEFTPHLLDRLLSL